MTVGTLSHPAIDTARPAGTTVVVVTLGLPPSHTQELPRHIGESCRLRSLPTESDFLERLHSHSPVALVLMNGALGDEALTRVAEAMSQRSPGGIVLAIDEDNRLVSSPAARLFNVRVLPGPARMETIGRLARDYVEQFQVRGSEEKLLGELQTARGQLDELSEYVRTRELSDTTEVLRLHHLVAGLSSLHSQAEIGRFLVATAARLIRSQRVSLLVPEEGGKHLVVVASIGIDPEVARQVRIPVGAPVCGEVFAQRQTILGREGRLPPGWDERVDRVLIPTAPFVSMVLSGPDWPVAVLTASEPLTPASFTEETLTGLHAVAEAAAIALVNQIREQERDDARDKIMLALAKLAESRDPETGKHLERVQNYCRILAEQLATTDKYAEVITPDFIRTLVRSSPLHDIGKVGIPDEILLKPGRLTTQEFEIMKRHPIIGGDTIRTLVAPNGHHDFLKMAMEIAYHHHEKYDGTGYPAGLAGEAIPLSARIIAVADVYDALTSVRVYKAAMPHERAREIVFEGSGKHFDPTIVQAFLDREPEFAKLARDLADTDKW